MQTTVISKTNNEPDAEKKNRTPRPILDKQIGRGIGRFGERLEEVIGGKSVRAFARRAKMAEGTLRQYISGNRYPDLDFLVAIAETAGVNILWLATGEGEKYPCEHGKTNEETGIYTALKINDDVLVRSLEAVDEALALAGREVGIERKAGMVAAVYGALARPGQAADHAEIMRLIRSMLG